MQQLEEHRAMDFVTMATASYAAMPMTTTDVFLRQHFTPKFRLRVRASLS